MYCKEEKWSFFIIVHHSDVTLFFLNTFLITYRVFNEIEGFFYVFLLFLHLFITVGGFITLFRLLWSMIDKQTNSLRRTDILRKVNDKKNRHGQKKSSQGWSSFTSSCMQWSIYYLFLWSWRAQLLTHLYVKWYIYWKLSHGKAISLCTHRQKKSNYLNWSNRTCLKMCERWISCCAPHWSFPCIYLVTLWLSNWVGISASKY